MPFSPATHRPLMRLLPLRLALIAALQITAFAQEAGVPAPPLPPGIPLPPGVDPDQPPVGPAQPPAPAPEGLPVPAIDNVLRDGIAIPNASILGVVVPLYQDLTNRQILRDTNIADNNVGIVLRGPVDRAEAIEFIEDTLMLNGYVFVPTNRENTFKLVNAGGGQNPRSQGLPVFTDENDLPESDALVVYVMNLDFIKPEEAVRLFPQIVQLNAFGSIAQVNNASSIIITENVPLIRQIIALKKEVDVPSAQTTHRFFELERADASRVADFLRELLEVEDFQGARTTRQGGAQQAAPSSPAATQEGAPPPPATPGAGGASEAGGAGEPPPIKLVSDDRTNGILVVARPLDMSYIESLIKIFDAPSKARNFLKRPLRFVTATQFLPLVADALSRDAGEDSGGAGGITGGGATPRSNVTQSQEFGSRFGGQGGQGGQGGFGGQGSRSGTGSSGGSFSLGTPEARPVAESVVVGKTLLVADNERNTIIVSGPPESVLLVEQLLDQIDVRPRQIVLATVIGSYNISNDREINVQAVKTLSQMNSNPLFFGAGALNLGSRTGDLVEIDDLLNLEGFPTGNGLGLFGRLKDDLNMYVRLLENTGRFRVLSRPMVATQNNRKAIIQSGQRIAVPTNSITNLTGGTIGGSVSSSIDYRDVVLKLEVIPLINNENEVTLEINQLNDNVIGSQEISGNTVPIISTQELVTTVSVGNGQTILLGGLITERNEKVRNGIPILVHIPIINTLTGYTKDNVKREELLIFIQPRIIDTEDDLIDANISELNRTEEGRDVLRFAVPEYDPALDIPEREPVTPSRRKRPGSRF